MNLKRWKKMKILCFNGKSGNIWEHILGTYISSVSTIYTIYIYICYHCYHCYHSYPYRKKNILTRLIIIIYFVNILTKNENILFYIRTTKKSGNMGTHWQECRIHRAWSAENVFPHVLPLLPLF